MDLLKSLTKRKISVRSPASAVQDLTQKLEYNADQCRSLYNELTDGKATLSDEEIIYHTRYLVNEIVRANISGVPLTIDTLVRDSGILATAFLKRINGGDLSFLKAVPVEESENSVSSSNSDTSSNFKKGQKKRIAEDVYCRMCKEHTRADIVQTLIENGLDEQSATSYYYQCARKFGKPESEIGKKTRKGRKKANGVKKSDTAISIYRTYWESVPKDVLIKKIAEEMDINEKDAAGYYYVGRRAVGAQSEALCPNQKKRIGQRNPQKG